MNLSMVLTGFQMAKRLSIFFILFVAGEISYAQERKDSIDFTSLSFEDLMNVKIVSASKKSESLFDAPLSASVITKDEIQRSGATSIMEALRLIPGIIVRQLTNGNYDIHIRGLDNTPPNALRLNSTNTTTLVMIDNRPVYNYLQGGIFWNALAIDLHDINRIEVIRGPSSTLYGPNAVSGVINIITNKIENNGFNATANVQTGSFATSIINGSFGYRFNKKISTTVSGNYQTRGREVLYQDLQKQKWYDNVDSLTTTNADVEYPHPDKSLIKYGVNTFIQYKPIHKVELNFSAGLQNAELQSCTFDSFTSNINTFTSKSHYVDLQASMGALTTQLSYNAGNQHTVLGFKTSVDFNTADVSFEYALKIKRLSLKPGIAYRSAIYDDTKRGDVSKREGTINGRHTMETYGGTLRGEYTFAQDRIRITGGIRADKFTHPGGWFVSHQAASSFKLTKNNIFRVVYSKAFRSPFIYDTYQDIQLFIPLGTSPEMYMVNNMFGNKDLNLLSSSMLEFGYRTKVSPNITVDLEAHSTKTENFTAIVTTSTFMETPENFPYVGSFDSNTNNIPLWVRQTGATLSVNFNIKNFQFKPFITIQKTTLHNYSQFSNTSNVTPDPNNNFDPLKNNIYSGMGTEMDHKFTPKSYGGVYVNYITGKFNFNVNAYAFTNHTFYHSFNLYFPDGRGVGEVKSKAIVNARVSYSPFKALTVFISAKNILNKQSREHYLSDLTPAMLLGGVTVNL